MTEDPIKLYVVVMGILLVVLGVVTFMTWQQASAYEEAIARLPQDAERIRETAAEVEVLVEQLSQSQLHKGPRSLIESAARNLGIAYTRLAEESPKRIGTTGVEERYRFDFSGGGDTEALTREQVARFCQAVELNSQGILKTLEIDISRSRRQASPPAGTDDVIRNDRWTGQVVFGLRRVD